jgi:transposase
MVKDLTEKKREALIQKQILIDEKKKAVEDKLIKTAVAVKKKQLVEEARLAKYTKDMEEEIPDEVVRKIIKEKNIPKPVLRREPQIQQIVEPPNPFAKYYFLP